VSVTPGNCPCTSLWNPATTVPAVADAADANAVELGLKFRADIDGFITGLRFYKSANNLTLSARDPLSKQPELKACAVRLRRLGVPQ